MSNFDVPTPLEPRSASALLLRVLRDCINRTNAVVACIQKWPEFEKQGTRGRKKQKTGEQEQQITQLIEVLNLLIHEINNIDMTLGEESSGGELWGIDVPIDMVVLMDHEDLNPELYVKQLLKVCLNMEANLQRRKGAMRILGEGVRKLLESRKKRGTEELADESVEELGAAKKRKKL